MSLFKRGGVWWNYFNIDGVRHQLSTGTSNRRLAEGIARKQQEDENLKRHQVAQVDPDITFGKLAAHFAAGSACTAYHTERLKPVLGHFANTPVLKMTRGELAAYRVARQAEKEVSDATVNRDLSVLRRVINWSVDEGIIPQNPLGRIRLARERRVRRSILATSEEDALLAKAPDHLRRIIICALDTGMRRGEVTGQRWEDVDFPRKLLYVTRSKTPEGESREIPLSKRLLELLQSMRKEKGLIFTYEGDQLRIIKRSWKTAIKNAGIRYLRFHDLRHSFNSRLMEAGVMQEVRMALMGHSGGNSVHMRYTHVELPRKRDAITRLEAWVQQQRNEDRKEAHDASTESTRSSPEGGPTVSEGGERTEAVEEEVNRGGHPRTGGQAPQGGRRRGSRAQRQEG